MQSYTYMYVYEYICRMKILLSKHRNTAVPGSRDALLFFPSKKSIVWIVIVYNRLIDCFLFYISCSSVDRISFAVSRLQKIRIPLDGSFLLFNNFFLKNYLFFFFSNVFWRSKFFDFLTPYTISKSGSLDIQIITILLMWIEYFDFETLMNIWFHDYENLVGAIITFFFCFGFVVTK